MRKGSIKNTRINAEVMRTLSEVINTQLKDPRVHPMTTVTGCEVTPDLKYCKVFVSVLAGAEEKKETLEGLKKATPFLRHELAEIVNLRITPELTFILDESIENGMYMSKLIADVKAHDDAVIFQRGDENEDAEEDEDF